MYAFRVNTECAANCPDMNCVLFDRILELLLELVDHLRPSGPIRIAEYPAIHILRLDYEKSVWGDDQVVDLSSSVVERKCDVCEEAIGLRTKVACNTSIDLGLTALPPR